MQIRPAPSDGRAHWAFAVCVHTHGLEQKRATSTKKDRAQKPVGARRAVGQR